jgi:hypothetical protein
VSLLSLSLLLPQMVIACWCQREAGVHGAPPLSPTEQEELNFLYEEWAHPFFISIQEFCRLMEVRVCVCGDGFFLGGGGVL